jgi:hypothetical protein
VKTAAFFKVRPECIKEFSHHFHNQPSRSRRSSP